MLRWGKQVAHHLWIQRTTDQFWLLSQKQKPKKYMMSLTDVLQILNLSKAPNKNVILINFKMGKQVAQRYFHHLWIQRSTDQLWLLSQKQKLKPKKYMMPLTDVLRSLNLSIAPNKNVKLKKMVLRCWNFDFLLSWFVIQNGFEWSMHIPRRNLWPKQSQLSIIL
jgi:hypothetical protein